MAKHSKIKLPKRVAGIKIPKVIRKGPLGEFLNSHAGQVILAEAVVAAAAVFTAAKADEDVGDSLRHPVDGARRVGHAVAVAGATQTERLAHAFREAGRAFREALQEGGAAVWHEERHEERLEERDARPDKGRAKKKSSSRASSAMHH